MKKAEDFEHLGIRKYTEQEEKMMKSWLSKNKITLVIKKDHYEKEDKRKLKKYKVRVF